MFINKYNRYTLSLLKIMIFFSFFVQFFTFFLKLSYIKKSISMLELGSVDVIWLFKSCSILFVWILINEINASSKMFFTIMKTGTSFSFFRHFLMVLNCYHLKISRKQLFYVCAHKIIIAEIMKCVLLYLPWSYRCGEHVKKQICYDQKLSVHNNFEP